MEWGENSKKIALEEDKRERKKRWGKLLMINFNYKYLR